MLKKLIKRNRGEGYVDICVGVVVFVMILVISINVFSFVVLRVEMDRIADELLETATFEGCFGEAFDDRYAGLQDEYYPFDVECGADEYFNETYGRVQLGHVMQIEVSVTTDVKGLGVCKIPVTLTVKRSGLSEKYWK